MTLQNLLGWVPNSLTILRFVLGLALPFIPESWQFGILVFAGFTDLIDGWIARRLQLAPGFGQLADPIADKTLVVAAVITAVRADWLPWPQLVVLVSRDWMVVLLSGLALSFGLGNWRKLKPRVLGKLATAGQVAALGLLFWYQQPLPAVVWCAGILSAGSACDYLWQAVRLHRSPDVDRVSELSPHAEVQRNHDSESRAMGP